MPLFGASKKTPQETVKLYKEAINAIDRKDESTKRNEKAHDEINKQLTNMKTILLGSDSAPDSSSSSSSSSSSVLYREILETKMLQATFKVFNKMDFENRKDIVLIFSYLLRGQNGVNTNFVNYLLENSQLISEMIEHYTNQEICLNIGMMLRECVKSERLCQHIVGSVSFENIFKYIESNSFDLAADSFLTFKDILTRHKEMVAKYLNQSFDRFFTLYTELLRSENYVTKRQSLKLLSELLVERHNNDTLNRYVSNSDNLKLVMGLLKDKSLSVQYEAFHVFKIFVVTPNRHQGITDILRKNRDLLVEFLSKFQEERKDEEQFQEEKNYVIRQIKEIE